MPRHRTAALAGLFAVLAATVGGCGGQKAAPPAAPPAKVTVTRPPSAPARDYWEYNGRLDSPEAVDVRARVKGFLVKRYYQEGSEVTGRFVWPTGDVIYPGDLLYQIDKREYLTAQAKAKAELSQAEAQIVKAKADISNWQAQIELAKAELRRIEDSVAKGVGSKTDLDKAKATLDVNRAQLAAAEAAAEADEAARASSAAALRTAEIQLGYTDVRAPISGQIGRTVVTEGNLVGQSDPTLLTTIIRVDELYVYFDVPERDLLEYMRDAEKYPKEVPVPPAAPIPLDVRVAGQTNGEWYRGGIDYVETAVNPGTGTVRARGVIQNPRRSPSELLRLFVPGLYVQVRVPRGPLRPQLVLPEDALMTGQEGRFVYVVNEKDGKQVVEKRLVTLGPTVYRAPPPAPGEVAPGWVLANPNPKPAEKGPPMPARRPVRSVVAVTGGLRP
jgi:multidrug efflux pump subunit AcrA (membrane-fusion protein)